jgi:hypothetical protein
MKPMPGEIEEAKLHPNGWVYRIEGSFGLNDAIPPKAIVGAWKVDAEGKISGEFIPNAKYLPEEVDHEKKEDSPRDKLALWLTIAVALIVAAWIAMQFIQ